MVFLSPQTIALMPRLRSLWEIGYVDGEEPQYAREAKRSAIQLLLSPAGLAKGDKVIEVLQIGAAVYISMTLRELSEDDLAWTRSLTYEDFLEQATVAQLRQLSKLSSRPLKAAIKKLGVK